MTEQIPSAMTVSGSLALNAIEYFGERSDRRTKRLLIHRYPKKWLEKACEALIDLTMSEGELIINGKPLEIALIQPPGEVGKLKAYKNYTYGCSPDWPVRARDEGGMLLVLCPPDWYESLHESIRSNSFLPFDQGTRPGTPRQLLRRMIDAAGLDELNRKLLAEVSGYLLEEFEHKQHDRGIAEFLEGVETYLGNDPVPTPTTLRLLGLIPDDQLDPSLDLRDVRKRIRKNLGFQENLSDGLARSPSRYFEEHFPSDPDKLTREKLRSYVSRYDYDLRIDDPSWKANWPVDLTLDRLDQRPSPPTRRSRPRASLRQLSPAGPIDFFDGIPVVQDANVELVWDATGPEEAMDKDISVFLDGVEVPDGVARLESRQITVNPVPPGRHTFELRPTDPSDLQILGKTRCELFVAIGDIVPFAVSGQTGSGESFDVQPGRDFQLTWYWPGDNGNIDRWVLRRLGESGTNVEKTLQPADRSYQVTDGIQEPTDFHLTAIGRNNEELASATLTIKPIEESPKVSTQGSVAQALLDASYHLREESDLWSRIRSQQLKIEIEEPSATQYWVRIYAGSEIVWERAYATRAAELLDRFEKEFLEHSDSPWLKATPALRGGATINEWPLQESQQRELSEWKKILTNQVPEFTLFLNERRRLFEKMKSFMPERNSFVAGFPFATLTDEIRSYVETYEHALAAIVKNGQEFRAYHVLLSLIDSVAFVGGAWESPYLLAGQNARISAIAIGPTHPLRLLWLSQLEMAIRSAIELDGQSDFNPLSFEGISGVNYPPYVLDFDRRFYRNVGVSPSYAWALYLPETDIESDTSLSPIIQRELSLRSTGENVAVSADQIHNALAYYHEAHPFRDAIRFHYIGAGSGEKIVEALGGWFKERSRKETSVSEVTSARMHFRVNLLDVSESDEQLAGTGRAFEEYSHQKDASSELLERVLFSVQSADRRRFEKSDSSLPDIPRHHIVFGSEFFESKGTAPRVEGRFRCLSAWGLRNVPVKFIEGDDETRLFISALVPPPDENPTDNLLDRGSQSLHKLLYLFQIMSSVSEETLVYHTDQARMQVVEIDRAAMGAIERMHQIAEWVYIADAHIDVELFDKPAQKTHYILDYRPTIGALGREEKRHNYVITTTDNAQIVAVIERFLQSQYSGLLTEDTPNAVRDASRRLLETINRVSGRALLRILGRPAAVKGVVGMGLTYILYEKLGFLKPSLNGDAIQSIRLLIPIDDYFDLWWTDLRGLRNRQPSKTHADLLDVEIKLQDRGVVLGIQFLEVKNLRSDFTDTELRRPVNQVRSTYETLWAILLGPEGTSRRDAPIKRAELAQILDFHLRRSLMQHFGTQPSKMESARNFRSAVFEALAEGRVTFQVGMSQDLSATLSAGLVLHFANAPDAPIFSLDDPNSYIEVAGTPSVRYLRMGRDDIAMLVRNVGSFREDDLRTAVNGTLRPPRVTDIEPASANQQETILEGEPSEGPVLTESETESSIPVESIPTEMESDNGRPLIRSEQEERLAKANRTFDGFVGNSEAKELLIPDLVQALSETPARLPINLIFVGPPSTGKTELAKRMARTLGLPFLQTSASAISKIDDLLEAMRKQAESERARLTRIGKQAGLDILKFPPMCIFVDEAHELKNPVQNALLTLLEPNDRRGKGVNTPYVADVSDVTFIFATTDLGAIDRALRSRLVKIELKPYTVAETSQILEAAYPGWQPIIYQRLAVAGRLSPRIALERARYLARRLSTYINESPNDALDRLFQLWKIDEKGVSDQDRALLQLLAQSRQPLGVQYLSSQLLLSSSDIMDVMEPYLSQLGLMARATNGRTITEVGRKYLRNVSRPTG